MTIYRGLFVPVATGNVGTTPLEARLALAGFYTQNSAGVPRSGLHNPITTTPVTGNASNMSFDLSPVSPVINRAANDGVYSFTTTGTSNVATTVAPSSNSRIDLIWVKQNDTSKGDADNQAILGVTQGAVAASPTAPYGSVPAGALVLAEATIGTNIANASLASIVQVWRYTALRGAPVPVRNTTERGELTARAGLQVLRLDLGTNAMETYIGSSWILSGVRKYAEYSNAGFAVSGGSVSWDIGTLTLDATNTQNNTFANVSGALSGAVNITESGIYAVAVYSLPNGSPGSADTGINLNGSSVLAMDSTTGYAWEMCPTTIAYIPAGQYIRMTCVYTTARTTASRVRITKLSE